ncbi:MAG: glutathione S-transferase family protein [Albidovulum sp.]|nr:glutathione S-transferase family protein [Albidovulum sp.]MDE0533265.1 glutathione S-transferase family protein [Albidovulum sp.]
MLKVVGNARSRAFRVIWMLEELGEPFEHVPARPGSKEVTDLNPSGKIPVMIADGTAVSDSSAILHFLADRSGRLTYPAGTLERARQDSWTYFLLDELDACLWAAARHSFVLPEDRRVSALKPTLRWEFANAIRSLSIRIGSGPFLAGARMTVPDIVLGHCARWAGLANFEIAEPKVSSLVERLHSRDAYRRATSY